jgi:hypothetical protein
MSTSNIPVTHKRTGTIESITRSSNSSEGKGEPEETIRVWPYWTSRPTVPYVAVVLFLSINIVTTAAWAGTAVQVGEPAPQTLRLGFGLFSYLAICYLVGLNWQLVGSNTKLFSIRTLFSFGSFIALVALIPYIFKRISVSDNVRNAAVLSLLLLLAMRFLLGYLMRHKGMLIVGTGHHAQQLYSELVDKKTNRPLLRGSTGQSLLSSPAP